jgi:hypothetical protein
MLEDADSDEQGKEEASVTAQVSRLSENLRSLLLAAKFPDWTVKVRNPASVHRKCQLLERLSIDQSAEEPTSMRASVAIG